MDRLLEIIANFLTKRSYEVESRLQSERFSEERNFNFKTLGNGKGVRNFTVQNEGRSIVYVGDHKQKVNPGNSFTIQSPYRITNEQFKVEFGAVDASTDASLPTRDAIAYYLVDTKC